MRIWLRELRVKKLLSQKEIGRQLNISESYYNLIENGERQKKMSLSILLKLSRILDIPIQTLIGLESDYISDLNKKRKKDYNGRTENLKQQ